MKFDNELYLDNLILRVGKKYGFKVAVAGVQPLAYDYVALVSGHRVR